MPNNKKTAPPPGSHVFPPIWTIFELSRHIKKTHVLTKFHKDWTKNVTSRVFTCFHYIHIKKTGPPPGGHVFSPIWTIFELFHDDWALENTALPPGGHLHEDWASNVTSTVFTSMTQFRTQSRYTNVLTKFHEDRTINVASGVFTMQMLTAHDGQKAITKAHHEHKKCPPTGGHVFQATGTIFELVQNIIGTNLLTKFHADCTINMASRVLTRKNATPPWRPYIIGTNHLIKFHDDRTINVASRVLTRKNAPPPDRKINVAFRVSTRKNAPPPGGHVFQPTDIIF
ncbi:hypothetical protein DPMN_036609 [Dreissena polymorpha]|uniref:Uncharacterized protein n=1 Tax=Dreissena polymorpha TaxID=45954 RepID=A0A9D4RP13_DREPO|nr:hypothetical protein DPMN_036609 [Dreissena polymorpha]